MTIRQSLHIALPPAPIYAYITDPEKLGTWVYGFQGYEAIAGRAGEVGAESWQEMLQQGRRLRFRQRTTVADAPRVFENHLSGSDMDLVVRYELRPLPDAGSTELLATQDVRLKSFFLRSFAPMVEAMLRKSLLGDLEKLRKLLTHA